MTNGWITRGPCISYVTYDEDGQVVRTHGEWNACRQGDFCGRTSLPFIPRLARQAYPHIPIFAEQFDTKDQAVQIRHPAFKVTLW